MKFLQLLLKMLKKMMFVSEQTIVFRTTSFADGVFVWRELGEDLKSDWLEVGTSTSLGCFFFLFFLFIYFYDGVIERVLTVGILNRTKVFWLQICSNSNDRKIVV